MVLVDTFLRTVLVNEGYKDMFKRECLQMKVKSAFLTVVMVIPMIFGNVIPAAADEVVEDYVSEIEEAGEEEDAVVTDDDDISTYTQIKTIADLYAINNDLSGKYVLMNDIDMAATDGGDYDMDGCGWKPIGYNGSSYNYFTGIFDGNGHKLKNLTFKGDKYTHVGLFAGTSSAIIRNLGIENLNAKCNGVYIGGIVGRHYYGSYIEKCYVLGNIEELNVPSGNNYIGGIAGKIDWSSTYIWDCFTSVNIKSKGSKAGGISCSDNNDLISNCYTTKSVTTTGSASVAMISPSRSKNCYFLKADGEDRTDNYATGLSLGMMKTASSFTGFDFEEIWCIDPHAPNNNFPQLKSCLQDSIESIEIVKTPDITEYYTTSTNLILDGGKFKINYKDGTVVNDVDMNEAKADFSFAAAGNQHVTIEYCGVTTTFDILIRKSTPTFTGKTEYSKKVGDYFKLDMVTDSDGSLRFEYHPENSNERIIKLDDTDVECLRVGEATVEVSVSETSNYEAASEEIHIVVREENSDDPDDDDDDSDDDTKYYKVFFVTNGGSEVRSQKVEEGGYVEKPTDPYRDGYYFAGWYANRDLTIKWNFDSNVIYADTTLYAKWETLAENVKDECVVFNGDIVSYNGIMYFMSGTKINVSNLFTGAASIESSDKSVAKVNKKGVVSFKKNGNAVLAADTGERVNITVFGKKPDKVSIRVGETYTLPDDVIIETLGDVRYSNPSKIVVSDDGKITATQKGIVKVKYTQSGKTRIIMKIKISN